MCVLANLAAACFAPCLLTATPLAQDPPAQSSSVESLRASNWRVRNIAAVALATSPPPAEALLAFLASGDGRNEPTPEGDLPELGGGQGADRVQTAESMLRNVVASWDRRAPSPRHLRSAADLVVPFTPHELALWVAVHAHLDAASLADGALALLYKGNWSEQWAAALVLWRLGAAAETQRRMALADPRTAPAMVHSASEHLHAAAREVAQALRNPDRKIVEAILHQLRSGDVASEASLSSAVLEVFFDGTDSVSRVAGMHLRKIGAALVPELQRACDEPGRRARAVGLLLLLGPQARPAGEKLLAILAADRMDATTRSRAGLALASIAPDADLAARAVAAILQLLERPEVCRGSGVALLLGLGGLRAGMPAELPTLLADWQHPPVSRVPGGSLAAFHALRGLGAVDALTVEQLVELAYREPFADRSVRRELIRRGMACAQQVAPLLVGSLAAADHELIGVHLAAGARQWLVSGSPQLRAVAARSLATLGARAGVDPPVVEAMLGDGNADLRQAAGMLWAKQTAGECDLGRVARALDDAGLFLQLLLELPLPADQRRARLAGLLGEGGAMLWRQQSVPGEELREIAAGVLARDPQHGEALLVIAHQGARGPQEEAWLLSAVQNRPTPDLLYAMAMAPTMTRDLLAAVDRLIPESGSIEEPGLAAAACACLWRHR
jgi:hypothetical protein